MATAASADDRAWFIAQRWQQYQGEARANLLRIGAVGVFYLLHLWNYAGSQGKLAGWGLLELSKAGAVDRRFHLLASLLALGWAAAAAAVHLALQNRVFPRWISAASTAVDLGMLTAILSISSGPKSALVAGYFLIIVLAGLRFSLPLVWLATVGAVLGYVCLLGMARWPERFGQAADADFRVPRYEQLATLAALVLCGVFLGQVVRAARSVATEYCRRTHLIAPPPP